MNSGVYSGVGSSAECTVYGECGGGASVYWRTSIPPLTQPLTRSIIKVAFRQLSVETKNVVMLLSECAPTQSIMLASLRGPSGIRSLSVAASTMVTKRPATGSMSECSVRGTMTPVRTWSKSTFSEWVVLIRLILMAPTLSTKPLELKVEFKSIAVMTM